MCFLFVIFRIEFLKDGRGAYSLGLFHIFVVSYGPEELCSSVFDKSLFFSVFKSISHKIRPAEKIYPQVPEEEFLYSVDAPSFLNDDPGKLFL